MQHNYWHCLCKNYAHPVSKEQGMTQCLWHSKTLQSKIKVYLGEVDRRLQRPQGCRAGQSSSNRHCTGASTFWLHKLVEYITMAPSSHVQTRHVSLRNASVALRGGQAPVWAALLLTPGSSWQFLTFLTAPSWRQGPGTHVAVLLGSDAFIPWDAWFPNPALFYLAVPTYSSMSFSVSICTPPPLTTF